MNEEWKDIKEYEGFYQISDFGRVRNLKTGKVLKHFKSNSGYGRVDLQYKKPRRRFQVHRLVALHFLPLVDGKEFVNHKDLNRKNNHVFNIEWCTRSENLTHAWANGCFKKRKSVKGLPQKKTRR